eukprot:CAMPEP_0177727738 /NCGR_PEP_ID=MMETSP0484_2-20121128/20485_1 /TAXON_ID=354590 /ORGANISM="Rhodomonas lens, Strain RHODO" /LENGTH=31 /DNA_ID= /DNA_START= /DNA_END= /DNA_ORIENTATION=
MAAYYGAWVKGTVFVEHGTVRLYHLKVDGVS